MRFPKLFTASTAAMGVAVAIFSPALATDVESLPGGETRGAARAEQCLADLRSFDEELERLGFGVLPPDGYGPYGPFADYYNVWGVEGSARQKMRALRDAAYVYAWDGDEQSCQNVLASMREVYADHQRLIGTDADQPSVVTAWRRAHLENAEPVTSMDHLMRADVLIGSEIRNLDNEKLGEVEDLVLSPGRQEVLYVLASRGGFLGFGGKLMAIRFSDLRTTEDHEVYVLNVPQKALEDAPEVDRSNFEGTADAGWQEALNKYWDGVLER